MPRLNYQKVNWEDAPSTATPLNAENLDNMDNGLAALYQDVADLEEAVENIEITTDITNLPVSFGEPGEPGVDDAPLQPSPSSLGDVITGIHSRIRAMQEAGELKAYYGSVRAVPTVGDTFLSVTVSPPLDATTVIALIPIGGSVEEEIPVADDEEEQAEQTEETTNEVSSVAFEGVNIYRNSIWCRFIGPIADAYEIQYLFLYY